MGCAMQEYVEMTALHDALQALRALVAAGHRLDHVLPDIARQYHFDEALVRERWLRAYKSEASVRAFARATHPKTATRRPFIPETELEKQHRLQDAGRELAAKEAREEGLRKYLSNYRTKKSWGNPGYAKKLRKRDQQRKRKEQQREREEQHARAVRQAARQRRLLKRLGKHSLSPLIATVRYWDVPTLRYLQRLKRASKVRGDGRS
jgi:hypothetical protein